MYKNSKINIYKEIIHYLLQTTKYSLKKIAFLSGADLKNIRLIYSYDEMPINSQTEIKLLKLYQIIIELEIRYGHPKFNTNELMEIKTI